MPTLMTDQKLALAFVHRDSRATRWIEGTCLSTARPEAMFADFEAKGWTVSTADSHDIHDAFIDGTFVYTARALIDFCISKKGTDFNGGWTGPEALKFLGEARRILRKHGHFQVPTWSKGWAEAL